MEAASTVVLSIVLPAHNEEQNIKTMLDRVKKSIGELGPHEIIFVDDGSRDGTLALVRKLASDDDTVRYISFTRNFGHQAALRAGMRHARGQAVILMDCDFEHPPELLPSLVSEWKRGAKIVTTQRQSSASASSLKQVASGLFYKFLNAIGDVHLNPGAADFLLLDRDVVEEVNAFHNQDVFLRGLVRWLGFKVSLVPYAAGIRGRGEPSFTFSRMVDLAVSGIVAHSIRPLRLAIYFAFSFAVIGLLLLVYSLVSFLWIAQTVVGWTSVMGAIAILGAGQFLVLGIIGEYVGRILREARKWPSYIVAETEASVASAARDKPIGETRVA
jgi:glycosyltransferase involved in cell wall biosynthesis